MKKLSWFNTHKSECNLSNTGNLGLPSSVNPQYLYVIRVPIFGGFFLNPSFIPIPTLNSIPLSVYIYNAPRCPSNLPVPSIKPIIVPSASYDVLTFNKLFDLFPSYNESGSLSINPSPPIAYAY